MSFILRFLFLGILFSCGAQNDEGKNVTSWDETFVSGFAFASPLAAQSGFALLATLNGDEPLQEKTEFLDQIAEGTSVNACQVQLPVLGGFSGNANCYGPTITYSNHPDGPDGGASLPSGDLGIWEASAGGEVCVAAQMNTLVKNASRYVDAALMIQASMVCLLKNTEVPFVSGESVDITSQFQTSIQASQPNATISSASVSVDGALSSFLIVGTLDTNKPFSLTIKIKQKADDSYQGRIYGFFTTTNVDAFSVTFIKNGSDINTQLTAGTWSSETTASTIFNADGDLNQDDSFSGNMNNALFDVNTVSGAGQISYAWQAGSGDSHTRVFNSYVNANGSDGCGYFGFGNDFNSDLSLNTNSIQGFICNWAGPGNDHSMTGTESKAQRQCFSKSNGVFIETEAKRAITYAPSVNCNDEGAFTYDWPAHSGDNTTNNLVDISVDADYDAFSAPSIPTLDSDL